MTTDMTNTAPTDADNRTAGAGPVQRSVSRLVEDRAEFERWFCIAYHRDALEPMEDGCYLNRSAGMAWDAWQAAIFRAQIALALPETCMP